MPGILVSLPILASIVYLYFLPTGTAQSSSNNSLAIPLASGSCPIGQYFDTSVLTCTSCPTGFFPTSDQLACQQCDSTSGFYYYSLDGYSVSQNWTSSTASISTNNTCSCPTTFDGFSVITATVFNNGSYHQRCVLCPAGYSAADGVCEGPAGSSTNLTASQYYNLIQPVLSLGSYTAATTASFPSSAAGNTPQVSSSYPLATYLGPSAWNCYSYPYNRASCNSVANLCALQLYSSTAQACIAYSKLVSLLANKSGESAGSAQPATDPLPWLFYNGNSYSTATDLGLNFVMRGSAIDPTAGSPQTVSVITIVLSAYSLNGTWLGYRNWTKQFQICGTDKLEAANWNNFGWDYQNACQIDLQDILLELQDGCVETVLYDVFIQNGANTLYPIPVIISPNLQGTPAGGAVRRFFYVDGSTGRTVNQTDGVIGALNVVQYPTSIQMIFTLQTDPRNQIYPPVLYITYSARAVSTSLADVTDAASFTVSYVNNDSLTSSFWKAWKITLIVILCVISFPVFVWKLFALMRRRRGADDVDQDLLFRGLILLVDIGSAGLTFVLLIVSLYYLILYKLQQTVYFMMLPNSQLQNFQTTVILAIVGQTVGLLNMIYAQTKIDVFFLDWEKPRKVLAKDGGREEVGPVSCWRTLFLCNEFNKLQTKRWTSPGLTLLFMCMILVGNNVIVSGDITPYGKNYKPYVNNVSSILLRFGTEVAFFLVLLLGQLVLIRLLYFRYISNPVSSFIDLAFLSNVSVFIFDERHSGYYIHGRNQALHSDTGIRELNQELLKEEEGLVGNRGLVTDNTGEFTHVLNEHQTFNVFISSEIRDTYEAKMLRQAAQAVEAAKMRRGNVSSFFKGTGKMPESGVGALREIESTFKVLLDDVQRNHAKRVIDPSYFQMVTMLPPEGSVKETIFVHDYYNNFTSTMFIGNEIRLYAFEALFFCAVDMSLQNVTDSALVTFVVSCFLHWVRRRLGENNLAQKTLIDQHFMV